MPHFTPDHLFILPHAEEYRHLYDISLDDVLTCLNTPDTTEGLATDHFIAEKAVGNEHIYVYYYPTYPLHAQRNECYAIVDFIGHTGDDAETPAKHGA